MAVDQNNADYFKQANSWADDLYIVTLASRNRYRVAFFCTVLLASCLALAIVFMMPLTHTEFIVVHQAENGVMWVEPLHQKAAPMDKAQVESDLIRYVINRESYNAISYHEQYILVNLLSQQDVAQEYSDLQAINNKSSPLNQLGNQGYRSVQIENVIFIDNKEFEERSHQSNSRGKEKNYPNKAIHHNLAQINFMITDHYKNSNKRMRKPYVAIISWEYGGVPQNPEEKWRNWDGFRVTSYTLQQRVI